MFTLIGLKLESLEMQNEQLFLYTLIFRDPLSEIHTDLLGSATAFSFYQNNFYFKYCLFNMWRRPTKKLTVPE